MNKPIFGMILGGILGVLDGLSALVSAPETRPMIAGIVIGSTIKGLIVGVLIGLFARKVRSLPAVVLFGILVGALFAFLVAFLQRKYYLEIIIPGSIVGLIVGYATQRHREMVASMLVIGALLVPAQRVHAQGFEKTSYVTPAGERVLRHEAVLNAPLDSVWHTMTTSEGLRTFLAPVISLDFRVGGRWEVSYSPKGKLGDSTNIVNEIVTYLPREMFAIRLAHAPAGFPHADLAQQLSTVYMFRPVSDNQTRLIVSMVGWGTTTFTDMYYFEDVVAEVAKEAGMRGVLGETIIGFPVADAKTPAESLAFTEKYLTRFQNDPLVVPAIAPHALYTNSDETLKASRALANKFHAPLLIHLSETKKENDDALAQRHMTPTKILDTLGVLNGRTVAAHCVWTDEADMAILKQRGVGVAHCPSSNMKLASGVAPIVRMLALGINVGLGPDGPAGSNNDLDMFEEMDLAAKLQKVMTLNPQALPAAAALEMATIRGARALGLDREIGSLEAGKRADAILVRLDRPNAVPLYDAISQMVYALKAGDVRDVMVNGKAVVRDGRILTLNSPQILQKADEYRVKISRSLGR